MNDTELDRLLDTWKAPAVPATVRNGLRERLPRTERLRFGRPLRWALAIAIASATLAIGTEQTGGNPVGFVLDKLRGWYDAWVFGGESFHAAEVRNQIRASNPQVYVDGQLDGPITYKGGATMWVDIPGDGAYGISVLFLKGWDVAGWVHGNAVEVRAGGHQVRIVCDKSLTDYQLPVYVRRAP